MKFENIRIKNFRGIEEINYTPRNTVACLQGPVGRGKTSFIKGIQAAITGDIDKCNIREGTQTSELEFCLDKPDSLVLRKIHRNKANQLKINGKNAKIKEGNQFIENLIEMKMEDFHIVSSSEVLESLKPSEFNDFILKFIPEKITVSKLLEQDSDLSDATKKLIKKIFKVSSNEKVMIPDIKDACQNLKNENLLIKRELKRLQALIESFKEEENIRDLQTIEKELQKVMQDEAKYQAWQKQKKTLEDMKKNKEDIMKQLSNKTIMCLKYTSNDYLQYINRLKDALNAYKNSVQMNDKTIQSISETLEKLGTNFCPLHKSLICNTDKTSVRNVLRENMDQLVSQNTESKKKIKELEEKCKVYTDQFQKVRKAEDYNQWFLAKQQELDKIKHYIKQLSTSSQCEKYDFDKIKMNLMSEKQRVEQFLQHQKNKKLFTEKKVSKTIYDKAISFLDMDGKAIQYITQYYLNFFNTEIEKKLQLLQGDFEVKFVLDNGITYRVRRSNMKEYLNYSQLSKGEKNLISFLILDLLNSLTNMGILFLDDLNDLDQGAFEKMINLIMNPEFQKAYHHIFLAMVNHSDLLDKLNNYPIDYIY